MSSPVQGVSSVQFSLFGCFEFRAIPAGRTACSWFRDACSHRDEVTRFQRNREESRKVPPPPPPSRTTALVGGSVSCPRPWCRRRRPAPHNPFPSWWEQGVLTRFIDAARACARPWKWRRCATSPCSPPGSTPFLLRCSHHKRKYGYPFSPTVCCACMRLAPRSIRKSCSRS